MLMRLLAIRAGRWVAAGLLLTLTSAVSYAQGPIPAPSSLNMQQLRGTPLALRPANTSVTFQGFDPITFQPTGLNFTVGVPTRGYIVMPQHNNISSLNNGSLQPGLTYSVLPPSASGGGGIGGGGIGGGIGGIGGGIGGIGGGIGGIGGGIGGISGGIGGGIGGISGGIGGGIGGISGGIGGISGGIGGGIGGFGGFAYPAGGSIGGGSANSAMLTPTNTQTGFGGFGGGFGGVLGALGGRGY